MALENKLILPKTDIMLTSAAEVSQRTAILRTLDITMFSYTRVYQDGSFFDMSDRSDMIDYFYYQTDIYKHYSPDANPGDIGEGYCILTSAQIADSSLAPVRDDLNIDNSLSIIKKNQGYYEVWNYAAAKNNHAIINTYLNNLDYLREFSIYFTESMKPLIAKYEKDKIWRPEIASTDLKPIVNINKSTNIHKKNPLISKLSKREYDCLELTLLGYTAKQIAAQLSISPRTVEEYLQNAKVKFGVSSKSLLIAKVMELRK